MFVIVRVHTFEKKVAVFCSNNTHRNCRLKMMTVSVRFFLLESESIYIYIYLYIYLFILLLFCLLFELIVKWMIRSYIESILKRMTITFLLFFLLFIVITVLINIKSYSISLTSSSVFAIKGYSTVFFIVKIHSNNRIEKVK